jgi:hypothetical protein
MPYHSSFGFLYLVIAWLVALTTAPRAKDYDTKPAA